MSHTLADLWRRFTGKRAMRGTLTRLLLATTLGMSTFSLQVWGQCALITDNYSGQVPSSVCAPVSLTMDVRYKFILPVDPAKVQILYIWNDGTGATTLVPGANQGDTVFTASAVHLYPPADHCSYTAEAYVVYDGVQCVSSSRQEQTFSAWARDNQNGAVIITDPVVAQFCEGEEIIDVRFRDNSTFNCNIGIEPDKPNRITRWVQFIYGTTSIGGSRIPNVTIRDPLGNVFTMTDASGNSLPPVAGPIIEIPIPADGPTEISWPISAPAGAVAGDIFEITMRNWNICNPYDRNPFDVVPPINPIDGDYPPITTTALIEIITTPPVITNPSLEFCAGSPIQLNLSTSGGQVRWYTDSLLTNQIHTGSSFDPTGAPVFLDNTVSGSYSFWVTESIGACASAPSKVSFRIFDTPAPAANAGRDTVVCGDRIFLSANTPVIGIGLWYTPGAAAIVDPADPLTQVVNLVPGPNLFRWTVTNGPCVSIDEVIVTRDLQPDPAMAGPDQAFCDLSSSTLAGNAVTNGGTGTWRFDLGGMVMADNHLHNTPVTQIEGGVSRLIWTVESQYRACLATSDTMQILRDLQPDPANAGPDRGVCDTVLIPLMATPANHNGAGTWSIVTGTGVFSDIHDPHAFLSGLPFGTSEFRWRVQSFYNLCAASSDELRITRDESPLPAFAGLDQYLCISLSAPLGANSPSVGSGYWTVVSNPTGTPPVFNPSEFDEGATVGILPGHEGLYSFAWNIRHGSCFTSDTLSVDFGLPVTPALAGVDDSVCGPLVQLHGNHPGIGTGTWRKVSGPGPVGFIPHVHAPDALVEIQTGGEGTYVFEWRIESGSCPPSSDKVTVTFKTTPGIPLAADEERCGEGSFLLHADDAVNSHFTQWFDAPSGGNLLFIGNDFLTDTLAVSAQYWVSGYNATTGCNGVRRRVLARVNNIPEPPVASAIQHCGHGNFSLSVAIAPGGTSNNWYNDPVSGGLLGTGTTYLTPDLLASEDYYVSTVNDSTGCESGRSILHVQIDSIPGTPVASDSGRCGAGSILLHAFPGKNGTTNRWYEQPLGGSVAETGGTLTTPYLTASEIYYVTTWNETTGCEGLRVPVMANIFPVPGFPHAGDVMHCGADSLLLHSVPGADATINRWYDSIAGGTLLLQSNDYITPYLTATHDYYVSGYNEFTGCESSRREVQAIIQPEPGPNPILGPGVVGIGQTHVVYSVNYQPGSTYTWVLPPGMSLMLENQNFIIAGFPNLGTYYFTVTETNSIGCPGPPAEKQVVVKDNLIVLNIEPFPMEVCEGSNININVLPIGGTPAYSFIWTGATGYLSAPNVANPIFRGTVPGQYPLRVEVTDINGNKAVDSIVVRVHPVPLVRIEQPDTVVCAGNSLLLNSEISGGSGFYDVYSWQGPAHALSSVQIENPVFRTPLSGTYSFKLTVTDSQGCMGSDSISLLNDSPNAVFISDAIPRCSPFSVQFINQSGNTDQYFWEFGDGTTSQEENPVHEFSNTGTSVTYFEVILRASSAYGCLQEARDYITVFPNPPIEISTFPDKACAPADILLSATPGGFSYDWSFGDGQTDAGSFHTLHTFLNTTDRDLDYRVELVASSFFGCMDTAEALIKVHPAPVVAFDASPVSQMVPDQTVTFTNRTSAGNWTYKWRFGDDSTSLRRDPGSHTYAGPDDYLVFLAAHGEHCSDSAWVAVEILPHPPVAEFKPLRPGCMPLTIHFENSSTFSNTYLWEFGDGAVSNKPNPVYTYYEPGIYKIKLTAWGDGGADSYSTTNDVFVLPNAYFEIAPRYVYVNDQPVNFFNLSDHADVYLWEFGDGSSSGEMNPSHVYTHEGVYDITLHVWTENDCYDLYLLEAAVVVEPTGRIVFPNAFRPASPLQENRVFRPGVIDHVEDYHLMIFNRWGEQVFESFSQETGWDGFVNGKMAKQDVYVWKVEGKYTNGQTFIKTGDVTLMH